jgi:hypothetical protein
VDSGLFERRTTGRCGTAGPQERAVPARQFREQAGRQDHELRPGAVVFRSDRRFSMEAYSASHSQLLLRSNPVEEDDDTTIDLLFKPVEAVKIRDGYAGLVVRCATSLETNAIIVATPGVRADRGDRVFMLESQDRSDYVISMAFGWREGILSRVQGS